MIIINQLLSEQSPLLRTMSGIQVATTKLENGFRAKEHMFREQVDRIDAQERLAAEQVSTISELLKEIEPLAFKSYVSVLDAPQLRRCQSRQKLSSFNENFDA